MVEYSLTKYWAIFERDFHLYLISIWSSLLENRFVVCESLCTNFLFWIRSLQFTWFKWPHDSQQIHLINSTKRRLIFQVPQNAMRYSCTKNCVAEKNCCRWNREMRSFRLLSIKWLSRNVTFTKCKALRSFVRHRMNRNERERHFQLYTRLPCQTLIMRTATPPKIACDFHRLTKNRNAIVRHNTVCNIYWNWLRSPASSSSSSPCVRLLWLFDH